jgi:hypothetical protein
MPHGGDDRVFRTPSKYVLATIIVAALSLVSYVPASAEPKTYTYSVEHPIYGVIGTYTDKVEVNGDTRRIDTSLRVAVKILGIVVYREEADRTEEWRGARLELFHGVTTVNGKQIDISGKAQGEGFVITAPSGTSVVPANVYTSSPWSVGLPRPGTMMSTKNGKVEPVRVIDDGVAATSVRGTEMLLQHYEIITDKHQEVWSDTKGVPVRFRSEENGGPVDFILKSDTIGEREVSQQHF